jgi:hypothetical protein
MQLNGVAKTITFLCAIMFRSLSISVLDATLGAVKKDVAAAQLVCKQSDSSSNSSSNTAAVAPCSDSAITSSTAAAAAVSNAAAVQAPHNSSASSSGSRGIREYIASNLLSSSASVGPTVALAWGSGAQYRLGNGFDSIK